jgi:serine/threonine protein kinase
VYDEVKTKTGWYIVTDFCNGGNLDDLIQFYYVKKGIQIAPEHVKTIIRQVIEAVLTLSEHKLIHRDLKNENVMLDFRSEENRNK